MADTSNFEVDDIIDGRYKLVRQLGEGTYAVVWLAWDKRFNRHSVLKVLKSKIKGVLVRRRVIAEARIMASLWTSGHVHRDRIAEVRDVSDETAELIYIALEVVDGGDLQRKLYFEKPSVNAALSLFLMILHGVQVAHERTFNGEPAPVIHRDLKPGNVLLTKNGLPKVTDFGIAKAALDMTEDGVAAGPSMTTVGKREGTLGFAPKEQLSDASSVDVRVDLYALGVILACIVADFDPGGEEKPLLDLSQRRVQREYLSNLPDDIRSVIVKACQADLDDRYQNIREFIAAVEELIAAHPDTGEAAWTPREGRIRPAETPTPKTPAPAGQPAVPASAIPEPQAPPENHGVLWTRVDEPGDGSQEPTPDNVEQVTSAQKRPARRIVGGLAVIAVIGVITMMVWPKGSPTVEATPPSVETPKVEAPVEPTPPPTPGVQLPTPDPIEPKVETPAAEVAPAITPTADVQLPTPDPKPEVKPKAEVKKLKVEPPKAEDPKPPVTAKVVVDAGQTQVKAGDTVQIRATVVLPEGSTVGTATLRYRGKDGGAWQPKPVTVDGGLVKTSIVASAAFNGTLEYYIDVRTVEAPGKAIKSGTVTVTITQ